MSARRWVDHRTALLAVVAAALVATAFVAGRLTAPGRAPTAAAVPSPSAAGSPSTAESVQYAAGLRAGEAFGVQAGRALQEGSNLPSDAREAARQAFNDGYAAGTNDVFSGYDGGWRRGVPYVITLGDGRGPVTYLITSRAEVPPGDLPTPAPTPPRDHATSP